MGERILPIEKIKHKICNLDGPFKSKISMGVAGREGREEGTEGGRRREGKGIETKKHKSKFLSQKIA